MATQTDGLTAMLGVILIIVSISALIPAIVLNVQDDQTNTFAQDVNERVVITGDVQSRVTEITNQEEVNVSMFDRKTGEFNSTGQLNVGDTVTIRLEGEDINVTLVDVFGTNAAVLKYDYPLYVGWPDGTSEIVVETPLMILMAIITLIMGLIFTLHEGLY